MRLSAIFFIVLALAATACQTTSDPEVERELRYLDLIGP